ncbi:MAG: hypothetical protein R3F33_00320 [Planctomycetota bacterium]
MLTTLKQTLHRNWALLLFELVIVVIGVSVSFAIQDLRDGRAEVRTEQRLLTNFAQDLTEDKVLLEAFIEQLDTRIELLASAFHPEERAGLEPKQLDQVMDCMLSYVGFSASQSAWLELQQGGNMSLVRDKALVRRIINHYGRVLPQVEEWDGINRSFVLDRMFPFVDEHGPAFPLNTEQAYAEGYHLAFKSLEGDPAFVKLARTSRLFLQGQRAAFQAQLDNTQRLLEFLPEATPPVVTRPGKQ